MPIWQLREALEELPVEGPPMECRLWVASEWIIHCADLLLEQMSSKEEIDEGTARALSIGALCKVERPLSLERWEFWKQRLSELAADAETDTAAHISQALKSMDAIRESEN